MKKGSIILKNASELVTVSGFEARKGDKMNDLGIIENGAVAIRDGLITHVGKTDDVMAQIGEAVKDYEVVDCTGKTVMPGFVDSHTHFVFGGYRADEFSWRLRGDDYMEIMNRGGGIINSVRGTKEASLEELIAVGKKRLDSMTMFGVTTVEGKSGYGLDKETELKQLEAMKQLQDMHSIDIVTTFLGAHAVPKDYKGREDEFIDMMINDVMPEVAEKNLAEFCDIFCEKNVFNVEQSRRLLNTAKKMGMKPKIHADEIVRLGGAELAAEVGAVSADHLLQASDEGIKAMAEAGVIATVLPGTAYSLKEPFARARDMIDMGAAVALATDFNPGSCFTESIPLIFSLATQKMSMTTEEAITALTLNGAAAVDRADKIGSIDVGKAGDVVVHEFPSYRFLPYHLGVSTVEKVVKAGRMIFDKLDIEIK
ncbi:imidazolonepropionase [Fusibacter sp. JL216-2]|uniref:imidazolonepropionase n=1 Tax=Fusibacter sp. JL216-2 TaxID=3071453 RepID=UPI003D338DE9